MSELFYIEPLYWTSNNKYERTLGHLYLSKSEIKQILFFDNCEHSGIVTSEGSAFPINISRERALEIVSIFEETREGKNE